MFAAMAVLAMVYEKEAGQVAAHEAAQRRAMLRVLFLLILAATISVVAQLKEQITDWVIRPLLGNLLAPDAANNPMSSRWILRILRLGSASA